MITELLNLKESASYWENIEKAAQTLLSGKIVAFPTETVYGIGVNKSIGFRNSRNHVVRDLIKTAKVEIASTSANVSGEIPATEAQQVIDSFGDKIDMVLDDGPTQCKTPSTVIKIMDDTFEIIRHGVIEEERINRCLDESCISFRS
jgi:tRNA A37 threonylcarbamoyladenosine synthetase subunit TsaC/SUA5/YrdC